MSRSEVQELVRRAFLAGAGWMIRRAETRVENSVAIVSFPSAARTEQEATEYAGAKVGG